MPGLRMIVRFREFEERRNRNYYLNVKNKEKTNGR